MLLWTFGIFWLIAFIVYLGLCLLIEAVYPVRVRKKYALKDEHAKWFWSYKHFFLYLWAWIVNASLFMLFWEFNEILRPIALSLPVPDGICGGTYWAAQLPHLPRRFSRRPRCGYAQNLQRYSG